MQLRYLFNEHIVLGLFFIYLIIQKLHDKDVENSKIDLL